MDTKRFLALVEFKKFIYDCDDETIAKVIGVSNKTYQRRKKSPDTFTVGEVNAIMRFLRFSKENKVEVFV